MNHAQFYVNGNTEIGKGMLKIENENQFLKSIIGGGKLFPARCSIYLFRILALYISTSLRSAVW